MRGSFLIAVAVVVAAIAWIVSGQIGQPERKALAESAAPAPAETPPRAVRVRTVSPLPWERQLVLRGRTEASRSVQVRAETAGRIVRIGAAKGEQVDAGAVIAEIDRASRPAALAEAKGLLKQRELEYAAARSLSEKGFRPETQLAATEAQLEAARSRVAEIETDIARTTITAPFAGVLDDRAVELGDYVAIGDPVATVVDLDPVLVVGNVSEREVGELAGGGRADAVLVNSTPLQGRVRYVASVADTATRTFRVEIEIPNPDGRVRHGLSAGIQLPLARIIAHFFSPAVLTLDDRGRVGVKLVDADNRVVFTPVEILSDTPDGIWVGGLDGDVRLITVGQGYVRDGQRVEPVAEGAEPAS